MALSTMLHRALIAFIMLVWPADAFAGTALDEFKGGPKIGQVIPDALTSVDQTGAGQDFQSLKSEHGLILTFVHSVDW